MTRLNTFYAFFLLYLVAGLVACSSLSDADFGDHYACQGCLAMSIAVKTSPSDLPFPQDPAANTSDVNKQHNDDFSRQQRSLDKRPFPALQILLQPANSRWRHIYLEGDGNPWARRTPAKNPNSREKLALTLMQLDNSDSIYIQRPCYGFTHRPAEPCSNYWWTAARYSAPVVEALNDALDQLQTQQGAKPLVLIGHSGGGTLAVLMAHSRADVVGVVTIAGNLDPAAWTEHHHYLPLIKSQETLLTTPLQNSIFRWHLIGEKDNNIPVKLSQAAAAADPLAQLFYYPYNHTCCWHKSWPEIVARLALVEGQFENQLEAQ
jgi:predicted alpha/beta hydrolase family esterase